MPTKGDPGYQARRAGAVNQLGPISGDPNAPQQQRPMPPGGMQRFQNMQPRQFPGQGMVQGNAQPRPFMGGGQMPQRPFPGQGMQQGQAQPRPFMPQMPQQGMGQQMPQRGMGQMMQGMGQQQPQQDPQQQMAMLRMLLQRLQGGGMGQQIGGGQMPAGPQMSVGTGQNGMYW